MLFTNILRANCFKNIDISYDTKMDICGLQGAESCLALPAKSLLSSILMLRYLYLYLYLYLKVDGLVSNALNAHVDPMFVQPALERIDGWRHRNMLRKPVPICYYSVAK